jgi:DNA uptake protein ComE-like DNA-binding protein
LGGIFWLILGVRWACDRVYLAEGNDAPSPRAADISGKIDPNTADWQTLAAIPSMGEKKAQAIVAFRDGEIAAGHGPLVFRIPRDLERIKGIATAANLEPYLQFPSNEKPATKPMTTNGR